MNSMKFIKNKIVPKHKIVTYARFVSDIYPQKRRTNDNETYCRRKHIRI